MDIVIFDYETFWSPDFTLSKLSTEQYVRDPRFEVILCGFQVNDGKPWWVPRDDVGAALKDLGLEKRALLAQHAHFDGLVLNHHYGIRPKLWLDTLGMARALHGANAGLGLGKLAQRYGIGHKGDDTLWSKGLRYRDFTPAQLERFGRYCCNDVALTYELAKRMLPQFSRRELEINDQVIRMFTEPVFELDAALLEQYRQRLAAEKMTLLLRAGVQKEDLMSNDKFAGLLMELGVDPPTKISPTTHKTTWAFAKTDEGMQALQEHPDEQVQMLVEARLKNKTTIAEKGAERLLGMAGRGKATVYLKYSGASGTHRLSGGDKFNFQNPMRGSPIRDAMMAPPGSKVVVADSSTIEARLIDWLAGQDDMVEVYRRQDNRTGPDMYCVIAEKIYGRKITKAEDPDERQMGKVAKLGLGFGMGPDKFIISVRGQAKVKKLDEEGREILGPDGKPLMQPLRIKREFSQFVVDVYRNGHGQVKKLWERGNSALEAISRGQLGVPVDFRGIVKTCKDGLEMPGGLRILFPELRKERFEEDGRIKTEWTFWNGKKRERIYGAKVIENVIQCLARITVFNQCMDTVLELRNEIPIRWAHSMHDEGIFVTRDFYAPYALEVLMKHMRTPPAWAPDLPVNCEGGFHQRYGKAKK